MALDEPVQAKRTPVFGISTTGRVGMVVVDAPSRTAVEIVGLDRKPIGRTIFRSVCPERPESDERDGRVHLVFAAVGIERLQQRSRPLNSAHVDRRNWKERDNRREHRTLQAIENRLERARFSATSGRDFHQNLPPNTSSTGSFYDPPCCTDSVRANIGRPTCMAFHHT